MAVLDALPVECIAHILSLTTPRDICRSSAVCRSFRAAACSEVAWGKFLPPDLDGITSRASSPFVPPSSSGKRDAYFRLCDTPVLIDGGLKSFSLHRRTGKKCFMLGARSLSIVWGDTPEYWRWSSFYRSRFSEVVELRRVAWLEIHAKVETRMLSTNTDYGAYFVFKFMEGNDGFENLPVEVSVLNRCSGQKGVVYLDPDGELRQQYQISLEKFWPMFAGRVSLADVWTGRGKQLPQEREDGWAEVELGGFFTSDEEDEEVQMSLMEVTSTKWKSGLIIQGVDIRPRDRM
ncbi:putative F-box protein PP2-B12 [Punica granatum]|uniref:F-box domain-containing protein n=2 Tax=Punica granatum TaxID=22663 RepID=A0A218WIL8_PUNGR|nr:putative F-box protein PP2-B12 [Punica granatum]OWM72348.1 hypothetical protein CDL15_Pgr018233 [Punica granatum]PKI55511.1 hypothetical protein CRG98_024123 [Punica granatum]